MRHRDVKLVVAEALRQLGRPRRPARRAPGHRPPVTTEAAARPRFLGKGICPRCKLRGVGLLSSAEGPVCLECHPTHQRSES